MARFQKSFSMKLEGKIDARVRHAYDALENMAACAGIKDNDTEAQKARMNHHGWVMTTKNGQFQVPARRFVDVIVNRTDFAEIGEDIKNYIKNNLRAPEAREWDWAARRQPQGGYDYKIVDKKQTQVFGSASIGAKRLMNNIAKAMRDAQVSVIGSQRLPPNAPSVQKRKKGNKPLLDTGVMRSAITHWVEDAVSERTLENINAEGFE